MSIEDPKSSKCASPKLARLPKVTAEASRLGLVGLSAPMQALRRQIELFAPTALPVLIRGETGTGKELVAQALHAESRRRRGAFVATICSRHGGDRTESELFGHARGAFTGAVAKHRGLFDCANGGTLFLDELGELGAEVQAKLLRVVQNGEVQPLGTEAVNAHKVDVRIVSATKEDLEARAATGEFREDLFERLCAVILRVPPLRERMDDLPLLVAHFLGLVSERRELAITGDAMERLRAHDWPRNVRELMHVIEVAVALAGEPGVIDVEHLVFRRLPEAGHPGQPSPDDPNWMWLPGKTHAQCDVEIRQKGVVRNHGNQARAAAELAVNPKTLAGYANRKRGSAARSPASASRAPADVDACARAAGGQGSDVDGPQRSF